MQKQQTISPKMLNQGLQDGKRYQLIDVRSSGEYAAAHIPGAVNIPLEQVETRFADMHVTDPVVLVCQSGKRACMGHDLLDAHRDDLLILDGGTSAWEALSLPIVSGMNSRWSIERQVRLAAGVLVLVGVLLSVIVAQPWIWLAGFVGAGLSFAGLTNVCGMASLFAIMPWNRPRTTVVGTGGQA